MSKPNRLAKSLAPLAHLPAPLRERAFSLVLGTAVPFVGTAGLRVEELTSERAVVTIANRRKVGNHIGGVHAAAMALLAETATGFVVGMSVPDDKIPVVKSMKIDFKRRAKGGLRAVATLTAEDRARISTEPKGDVAVKVVITDEDDREPVEAALVWAWVPKQRDAQAELRSRPTAARAEPRKRGGRARARSPAHRSTGRPRA